MAGSGGGSAPNIGDVVRGYVASHEFRTLSRASKKAYSHALVHWEAHRDRPASDALDIAIDVRDSMWSKRPGMARLFLSVSSAMFSWATNRRLVPSNVIKGLSRPKQGEHKQWPDQVVDDFMATAPIHLKLVALIGLHTAQRIGDICAAKHSDIIDGVWHLTQSKTKTKLRLPLSPPVLEALKETNRSVWMLGRRWDSDYLSTLTTNHLRSIGHEGYTFHGLRKVAAARLAEKGCTVEELAAITGHKTLNMVAHYVKGADQARLAVNAMSKLMA